MPSVSGQEMAEDSASLLRLAGKRVFVTGAGGGIGRAICHQFLAQGKVAASALGADQASIAVQDAGKGRALALACDVGDSESVSGAIRRASAYCGGLDVICAVLRLRRADIRRLLIIRVMSRLNWLGRSRIPQGSWLERMLAS